MDYHTIKNEGNGSVTIYCVCSSEDEAREAIAGWRNAARLASAVKKLCRDADSLFRETGRNLGLCSRKFAHEALRNYEEQRTNTDSSSVSCG